MAKTKSERKVINSLNDGFLRGKQDDEIYWDLGDGELKDEGLKRNNSINERLHSLEAELSERNKVISSLRKQNQEYIRAFEEREKKMHESQIIIKTMEANLHQLEGERRQYLDKIEEYGKEISAIQDRYSQAEEDIKNLTFQLKARTQENIILNKENKDLQRTNNQLQESIVLLEDKVCNLNKELNKIEPAKNEMEKKFNRALDSLRKEVKAKHQEVLRLSNHVKSVEKANYELKRVNENLELELDMLNTTNISLQKKIERITLQNSILEKKLQNKLVRIILAVCGLFSWRSERKTKARNVELS
jgi:chromosome segregation ATPase